MMKTKLILTAALAITVGLTACKKRGDFTTDKQEYAQGDVITVTNTTEKASEFYKWYFNGVEVIDENPVYTIPEETPVGSFTIKVLPVNSLNTTANSKEYSRTVNIVEAEKAQVIFFLPQPYWAGGTNENCTVTFTQPGQVNQRTIGVDPTIPNCESSNNLSAFQIENLKSGTYDYNVSGSSSAGSYDLSGTITLDDGFDCRIIDISKL
ncbi:MAG: hypothetical protein AB8B72_04025 [Crocinitomicaceae bacterium]